MTRDHRIGLVVLRLFIDQGRTSDEKNSLAIIYLPLKQAADFTPEICEGLESADVICIDDIDVIAGNKDWEIALFNLYNRIRDNHKKLFITATSNTASLPIDL